MRIALRLLAWTLTLAFGLECSIGAEAPKTIEVKTTRPARGEIVRYLSIPGSLRANQQVTLYSRVPGYLKSIRVDRGDSVAAGASIAELEVPELLADAAKHRAELAVADAEYRRVALAQTKAPDLVVPLSVDEAKGRLDIAKANLERTETLLRYAKLMAPFSGVITARFVDPGAFIPAATGGGAGQSAAIVTIMDVETVRLQVAVPEMEASLVQPGQPVKFAVEGLSGKTFAGQVSRHSYALDDANKTLLVEADIPNPQRELRPGMYAMVKVGVEKHLDALLLPVDAVAMEKVNAFVFLLVDGRAKKKPIKIGFNDETRIEVLDGLKGDDAVILVGKMVLADGAAVKTVEAP